MNTFLLNINTLLLLINIFVYVALSISLGIKYDNCQPVFYQRHLWRVLDNDINWMGKLILCVLVTPFTILYTLGTIIIKISAFILESIWKVFCVLFRKK